MRGWWVSGILAVAAASGGCVLGGGSDDDPEAGADLAVVDATPDVAPDAEVDAAVDAAEPDAGLEPCGPVDITVRVDPDEQSTQIHPAVAPDGEGRLWVVYNRVTPGTSTFDIWATRLGCDGQPDIAPFEVSDDPVNSDVDPAVAVGPAGVMFAWSTDTEGADPNLSTRVRAYAEDGTPRGAARLVETTRGLEPFGGGAWMVRIAATAEGFVVVGARGVDELSAFQVYAQRVDADGAAIGPTASAERPMTQQLEPDVAVADDGGVWIVWNEGDQGAGAVTSALWRDDPTLAARTVLRAPAGSARVAAGRRALVLGHFEADGGTDIAVRPAVGDGRLVVGEAGAIDIQPALAVVGEQAVLAWFRRVSGSRAALWTQRIDVSGAPTAVGEPIRIETEADAAPYPMAATALADGRIAIVWTEGVSPDFRMMARFVMP